MTDNDPQLPDAIRKALKESPTFTPPESFYQGVLEKIERESGRAGEKSLAPSLPRSATPWYLGYPMRGLATACALVLIVLVTRETRQTKPELFEISGPSDKTAAVTGDASPAPATVAARRAEFKRGDSGDYEQNIVAMNDLLEKDPRNARVLKKMVQAQDRMLQAELDANAPPKDSPVSLSGDLAGSKEVQGRLSRDISGFVGNPSPFEEEDEKMKQDLKAGLKKEAPKGVRTRSLPMSEPQAEAPREKAKASTLQNRESERRVIVSRHLQARDTVSGSAGQNSFLQEQNYMARKRSEAVDSSVATAGVSASNAEGVMPEWKGQSSGITAFQTVVVTSQQEWETLWRKHTAGLIPPPPVPEINFDRMMVVGVFSGTHSTAGYSVTILDISTQPDKMVVSYRESEPSPSAVTAQSLTQPYHMKIFPKMSLPIVFQKEP